MTEKPDGIALARAFFARVWGAPHDLDAIDELMTPDYCLHNAGATIMGRDRFKAWVGEMQAQIGEPTNEHLDLFMDETGEKVVSRWITRAVNKGLFGTAPDGRAIDYTGISIWRVRDGRLAECWVERSALELRGRLIAD
ncbi:ester cyclase [Novosphingobium rosa]|uniref:ester cyclase n=1 Tax=Novosphingobium rosa TaxID=76978 RepID=UPI00082AED94|nr:nuclear transport factor 2 family protein [Novosphingobium rosa]